MLEGKKTNGIVNFKTSCQVFKDIHGVNQLLHIIPFCTTDGVHITPYHTTDVSMSTAISKFSHCIHVPEPHSHTV